MGGGPTEFTSVGEGLGKTLSKKRRSTRPRSLVTDLWGAVLSTAPRNIVATRHPGRCTKHCAHRRRRHRRLVRLDDVPGPSRVRVAPTWGCSRLSAMPHDQNARPSDHVEPRGVGAAQHSEVGDHLAAAPAMSSAWRLSSAQRIPSVSIGIQRVSLHAPHPPLAPLPSRRM